MKAKPYEDLGVFLAHSATLEREAAERFYELAAMMKVHNNDALHELFLELARYSVEHVNEVEDICKDHDLPSLKPWEYQWPDLEAPENISYESAHYLMSPKEALEAVYKVELKAEAFYRSISLQASDEDIRKYAHLFAEEEHEHAEAAKRSLEELKLSKGQDEKVDLDPPFMPE
ncbi:MAG: ferritin family protein [Pseudomonadales bacterium]|nr:ferritin family protein [Pseudomonadales bacterium]